MEFSHVMDWVWFPGLTWGSSSGTRFHRLCYLHQRSRLSLDGRISSSKLCQPLGLLLDLICRWQNHWNLSRHRCPSSVRQNILHANLARFRRLLIQLCWPRKQIPIHHQEVGSSCGAMCLHKLGSLSRKKHQAGKKTSSRQLSQPLDATRPIYSWRSHYSLFQHRLISIGRLSISEPSSLRYQRLLDQLCSFLAQIPNQDHHRHSPWLPHQQAWGFWSRCHHIKDLA